MLCKMLIGGKSLAEELHFLCCLLMQLDDLFALKVPFKIVADNILQYFCLTCISMGNLGMQVSVHSFVHLSVYLHPP